ncbi:hypothetical protein FP2506_02210 [Fulvimarina pelagi HTCC2506]|uniref:Uncharacterized protein n=3 Tax=Fulvimarina pelagi TaxID=217511 RepID=Q0FYH8_9HYPH|nr:hypothetical protein [Fulvimarina pelagi]EAU40017.1 hypothetical protein FP2506_02210 [Fulvimarina pelagi HTCC2506]
MKTKMEPKRISAAVAFVLGSLKASGSANDRKVTQRLSVWLTKRADGCLCTTRFRSRARQSAAFIVSTIAFCLHASSFAIADEAWVLSDGSEVIYETDIGDTAVLTYDYRGSRVRLYLPGLSLSSGGRGTFYGYWIEPDRDSYCGAELTGPDGARSSSWGRAVVSFDRPSFPSGWTAELGRCFEEPRGSVRADAIYGDVVVTPHRP